MKNPMNLDTIQMRFTEMILKMETSVVRTDKKNCSHETKENALWAFKIMQV